MVEELGFDTCVNYKDLDWQDQLTQATPDGVDADFENVGGEIMDAVLDRMNIGARIALCGMISEYNDYGSPGGAPGQRAIAQIIMQRATMTGFLVLDHAARFPEAITALAGHAAAGELRWTETVVDGPRPRGRSDQPALHGREHRQAARPRRGGTGAGRDVRR